MIFKDFLPYDLTNLLIFGLMIFAGMMVQVKREKRRPHFIIRMVITLLIMVADALIFAILDQYVIFNHIFVPNGSMLWELFNIPFYLFQFFVIAACFYFLYEIKKPKYVIVITMSYIIQHGCYQLSNLYSNFTNPLIQKWVGTEMLPNFVISNLIYVAVFSLLLVLTHYFFTEKVSYSHFDFSIDRSLIGISILTILVVVVFNTLRTVYENWATRDLSFIFCAFALFVCLMIAAILRSYVTNKMEAMRGAEEKRYYKNQLHSYEMVKENVELVNIKCHDLRKQIRLLTKNEHNEDIDKLLEIQDSLRIYDNTFKTDCDALNVVLSHESIYLNQSHVTMTVVADAKRLNDLDEVDIFSIFTNLLDNAINAANHIEEEEKRLISLTIEEKQGFLSIECRNYYAGKVDFKGSQKLPSTSKDGKYHGYGTKSIVATMRKYGGKVRFYTEDDQFIASLILPIEN